MTKQATLDLEQFGWGPYQRRVFWTVFNVNSMQAWTLNMLYLNSVAVIIYNLEELSNFQKSLLGSVINAGLLVGGYISGHCSDRWGRAYCMKRSIFLSLAATLALLFCVSFWLMLSSLFLVGLGTGCDAVVANTLALESFPPTKASKVTLISVAWSLGSAISYVVALIVVWAGIDFVQPWRIVVGVAVIYSIYAAIQRLWLKETLVFLEEQKRFGEYELVANYLYATRQGRTPKKEVQTADTPPKSEEVSNDNQATGAVPCESSETSVDTTTSRSFLCNPMYFKTTLILTAAYFFSSIGYSTLMFFMPIFLTTGSHVEMYLIILAQQLSGVPGKLLATCSVDSILGRKWTAAVGFFVTGLCLVPFALESSQWSVLLCTCLYYLLVNMGLSALFTHTQELYEGHTRGRACGFLVCLARTGSSVGPLIGGLIYELQGVGVAVLSNACVYCLIGGLYIGLTETRPIRTTPQSVYP